MSSLSKLDNTDDIIRQVSRVLEGKYARIEDTKLLEQKSNEM
jgi:hypothetical protein